VTSQLSGRLAAVLSVAAVLLALLVGWFVLIAPERSKASDLETKISAEKVTLQTTQAFVDNPSNKKLKQEIQRLKGILPDSVQMSQILRQLAAASAASGVEIDTITPSAPAVTGGAEAVPISVGVQGHYFNISKFMNILRQRARVVNGKAVGKGRLYSVGSLQFGQGGATAGGGTANTLAATVALNAYVYGGTAPATPPATTTTPTTTDENTLTTAG
jgi:Tfp pilus assembly protein PilO